MTTRTPRRRAALGTLLALAPLVLVACGSTAQVTGAAGVPVVGSGDGLGGPAAPGTPGAPVTGPGAPASPGASLGPGTPGAGPGAPGSGPTTPGAPAGPVLPRTGGAVDVRGPGVTATTIAVGYFVFTDAAAGQAALGAAVDFGDPGANARAIVAAINKRGGLAGRRVVLELHEVESANAGSFDSQYQAICEHFTTDVKVFAVAPATYSLLRDCLARKGVLPIGGSLSDLDTRDLAASPTYVDSSLLPSDAVGRNLVDTLAGAGYLTAPWQTSTGTSGGTAPVVLGIVHADLPRWQRTVKDVLVPELARRGVRVLPDNIFEYTTNTDAAGAADTVRSIQSAVLRFRANGVTHVLPTDSSALAFFATGAERQGYRPRYGVSSTNAMLTGVTAGLVPREQLAGATGLSWVPTLDLADASRYPAPGKAACLADLKAGGQNPTPGSLAEVTGTSACDVFTVLSAGVGQAAKAGAVTAASVARGVEALGGGVRLASLPAARYDGRRWPVVTGWTIVWDASAGTTRYAGGPRTLR